MAGRPVYWDWNDGRGLVWGEAANQTGGVLYKVVYKYRFTRFDREAYLDICAALGFLVSSKLRSVDSMVVETKCVAESRVLQADIPLFLLPKVSFLKRNKLINRFVYVF